MKILLIRHADPDYSLDGLTKAGRLEAEALGEHMARLGIDKLYASPLGRAQMTAGFIAERTGLEIVTEHWTKELGGWQAKWEPDGSGAAWDSPGESIPEISGRRRSWSPEEDFWLGQPEKASMYEQMIEHSDRFLARLGYTRDGGVYRCLPDQPERLRVALVCHGGFGLAWLSHILQLPLSHVWAGFWLPPSSVTTLLWERRSETAAVPRCLGLGDVSHLHAARLPVQSSGLYGNLE